MNNEKLNEMMERILAAQTQPRGNAEARKKTLRENAAALARFCPNAGMTAENGKIVLFLPLPLEVWNETLLKRFAAMLENADSVRCTEQDGRLELGFRIA